MKVLTVFASGGGSNFKAIHHSIVSGEIHGEIALLVSNNPNCGAVKYADEAGITHTIINQSRYPEKKYRDDTMLEILLGIEPDLIILAGYMKKIPDKVVNRFNKMIVNIHPALLPKFGGKGYYGMNVHQAVMNAGEEKSGATVHFVNEEYDKGSILAQEEVIIEPQDTAKSLAEKVLKIEHELYPQVIKAYCEDRIIWKNNQPKIEEVIEN
ncbi:MAG: phosphoribosylglycinamide formyltransferase [Candidatus Marinimicrobia bacterium]|nr:phosphoribosylglycinamide formyltransferase [Candidatus Neomarinimicrobiota bacterium]